MNRNFSEAISRFSFLKENEEPIKTVCAWCKKHIEGPAESKKISHGICPDCYNKQIEQLPNKPEKPNPRESVDESDEELRRLERRTKVDPSSQEAKDRLRLAKVRAGKEESPDTLSRRSTDNYNKRWKKIDKAPGDITFPQTHAGLRKQIAFNRNTTGRSKHIIKARAMNPQMTKVERDRATGYLMHARRQLKLLSAATKELKAHPQDTITTGRADRLARLAKRAGLVGADRATGQKIGTSRLQAKKHNLLPYMSTRDWAIQRKSRKS